MTNDEMPNDKVGPGGVTATLSIPTRRDNPFATCATRPGALAYRFAERESAATLVDRLAAQSWRGQIVGPHGSGKSTLLVELIVQMQRRGREVVATVLRDGCRWLPTVVRTAARRGASVVIVIDGYEQLGWPARFWLGLACRRNGCGLLITTHRPMRLPLLARTAPELATVQRLVEKLTADDSTAIAPGDVAASFDRHNGNVREIFFDLYDRYERTRRK
jgi:hypothetical protein